MLRNYKEYPNTVTWNSERSGCMQERSTSKVIAGSGRGRGKLLFRSYGAAINARDLFFEAIYSDGRIGFGKFRARVSSAHARSLDVHRRDQSRRGARLELDGLSLATIRQQEALLKLLRLLNGKTKTRREFTISIRRPANQPRSKPSDLYCLLGGSPTAVSCRRTLSWSQPRWI